jgi:hypothetical protein
MELSPAVDAEIIPNHATHSSVASSTDSRFFHGPRRWITSALDSPLIVSASALS